MLSWWGRRSSSLFRALGRRRWRRHWRLRWWNIYPGWIVVRCRWRGRHCSRISIVLLKSSFLCRGRVLYRFRSTRATSDVVALLSIGVAAAIAARCNKRAMPEGLRSMTAELKGSRKKSMMVHLTSTDAIACKDEPKGEIVRGTYSSFSRITAIDCARLPTMPIRFGIV